jgi:hypothetical protein
MNLWIRFFQALDTFNTAVVSPIYYTMFTSLTILASVIMFKVTASHYFSQSIPIVVFISTCLACFSWNGDYL